MKRLLLTLMLLWLVALAQPALAADTVYYYYTNSLHSTAVITDAHGNVVEHTTYYAPYGQVLNRSMRDGPGYTGHEEDPATGLVYMQQRYYDAQSGRFLSTDSVLPTDDGANFNRYWYANDNPYRYTDPDGRDVTEFIGGLFVETAHFVTGQGFNGSAVVGALKDGYNGEGGGVGHAILEDAETVSTVAGVAGAIKGGAVLLGRVAAKAAIKEGGELAEGEAGRVVGDKIAGYTKHGIDQAIGRDGGRGVHPKAILDAVKNPTKVMEQAGSKTKYVGKDATVVTNRADKVITTWGKPRNPGLDQ